MASLKISKKHNKHINNPFPFPPKSLPVVHGTLSFNPNKLSNEQCYQVGKDFLLYWCPKNGGQISVSHQSNEDRRLWYTVHGEAFVSAAAVNTEVEESRGSFVIRDGDVRCVCNHQFIQEIKVFYPSDIENIKKDDECYAAFSKFYGNEDVSGKCKGMQFPVVLITGFVFGKKKTEKSVYKGSSFSGKKYMHGKARKTSVTARYYLLFEQKTKNQISFHVKFGEPNRQWTLKKSSKAAKCFISARWNLVHLHRTRITFKFSRKGFTALSLENESEEETGHVAELNRILITYSSEKEEKFFGFGEQFSHVEFKGKRIPILVQEQGIGRGDQPITFAANLVSYRSAGDWSTSYAPSPFYMTSKMRSLYLEGYNYSIFDLTKHDRVQIQIHGSSGQGRIVHGNSPTELIENFTEEIGRPPTLPDWIISGAVIGMQGGTSAVRRIWNELQDHDVPVSAFWLQDWVGQRETILGSQLWWNWEVDNDRYSGWRQLVDDLHAKDIRVMTYCNPCLVPTHMKLNRKRDMFNEARKLGILVKDKKGETYMIPNTAFDVGMLDLTNPEAGNWFKKILQEMVDCGVSGWMADFGEGLPLDANLFQSFLQNVNYAVAFEIGEDPVEAHNRYPELWAKINREFVDEFKAMQHENKIQNTEEDGLVFFMRAGFRSSPKWATLFWEGDQMVSWQHNDGVKSSVTGLLSGGLSGFAFNHSDIGGYCAIDMPFIRYRRTEELLLRWMELNAFTAVFRTHEGNIPSANCQFYSNARTMAQFSRFAKVYKAWKFYRIQLMKEASEKGLPIVRHLFLHYPDDKHVHTLTYQQFLVGSEILVAPVLDKGEQEVTIYFPGSGNSWQHIWTGEIFTSSSHYTDNDRQGTEERVHAPIGYPAVFVKHGSPVGDSFIKNLKDLNIL